MTVEASTSAMLMSPLLLTKGGSRTDDVGCKNKRAFVGNLDVTGDQTAHSYWDR